MLSEADISGMSYKQLLHMGFVIYIRIHKTGQCTMACGLVMVSNETPLEDLLVVLDRKCKPQHLFALRANTRCSMMVSMKFV